MDLEPLHTVAGRRDEAIVATQPDPVQFSENWGEQEVPYREVYEPSSEWLYWMGDCNASEEAVSITVQNSDEEIVTNLETEGSYGFNTLSWNLSISEGDEEPTYLGKGKYTLIFETDNQQDEVSLTVE